MGDLAPWIRAATLAVLVMGVARSAPALVVAPPASNNNTSAPADDPGWLNVGDRGVYIGSGWVLTAAHVGAGATTFPGLGTFAAEPGPGVRLRTPDNTAPTDLLMYRLTMPPPPTVLPALTIASQTPAVGERVTLIGDGRAVNPTDGETHWNSAWGEVPSGGFYHGYESTTARKLWGTNIVEDDEAFFSMEGGDANHTTIANTGNGDTISFITEFDKIGLTLGDVTDEEAQALSDDSGSAVFHKRAGVWTLAGITHAIAIYDDQVGVGVNAVYGNLTLMADLSQYRNQILATMAIPETSGLLLGAGAGVLAGASQLIAVARKRGWRRAA